MSSGYRSENDGDCCTQSIVPISRCYRCTDQPRPLSSDLHRGRHAKQFSRIGRILPVTGDTLSLHSTEERFS